METVVQPADQVDQAINAPNKVDEALNAPAPQAPATFQDHLDAFNEVLNGIVVADNNNATPEGRWSRFDYGSIARRDYYDLGVSNPSSFDSSSLQDEARQLRNVFGNIPESALINNDVNPTALRGVPARRDMRYQFFPQGQSTVAGTPARASVKQINATLPPAQGQFGPGKDRKSVV